MKVKNNNPRSLDQNEELRKIANRLRVLRKEKGYSNMDIFAYEHGFGRAQYGRYENGQDLRYSTIVRLANCFNLSIKEFFSEGFD